MKIDAIREEIKLRLTGGLLELELDDKALDAVINAAFRELQRYICSTRLMTLPYQSCIDLSKYHINSVSRVFRTEGYMAPAPTEEGTSAIDPMYVAQWQLLGGTGNMYNVQNWAYNFGAWNTMLQIKNTLSTDLTFRYERYSGNLYVNVAYDRPTHITIEYVPRFDDVSEIDSDYWIDMLVRLSVALAKVTVGRIRSRYTQSNALWSQDGEALLTEGNEELTQLREYLAANTQLNYPID